MADNMMPPPPMVNKDTREPMYEVPGITVTPEGQELPPLTNEITMVPSPPVDEFGNEIPPPEGFEMDSGEPVAPPEGFVIDEPTEEASGVPKGPEDKPWYEDVFEMAKESIMAVPHALIEVGSLIKKIVDPSKADEIAQNAKAIQARYYDMGTNIQGLWDADKRAETESNLQTLRQNLVNELANQGYEGVDLDPKTGDLVYTDSDGSTQKVDYDSFAASLRTGKGELGGAIGGAVTAGRMTPGTLPMKALGAAAGGAIGAFTGAGADVLLNQMNLIGKLTTAQTFSKMADAGVMEVAGAAIGVPIGMTAKYTVNGVKSVYDHVIQGNAKGAYEEAILRLNVTPEKAQELVKALEEKAGKLTGMTPEEKVIYTAAKTEPRFGTVAARAVSRNDKAGTIISRDLNEQANVLLEQANKLSNDGSLSFVKQGLDTYKANVGKFYGDVVGSLPELAPNYSFDYDKLIKPLADSIPSKITDVRTQEGLQRVLEHIGDVTQPRDASALLDMRQTINEFKFNNSNMNHSAKKAIDEVIGAIDGEIDNMSKTIPNGNIWKEKFDVAKVEYAKMKALEGNVLYKALNKPGISADDMLKTMGKYIKAEDDTFIKVMSKLPKSTRDAAEGAVLKGLLEKHTIGMGTEAKAVDFMKLNDSLGKYKFASPEAQQLAATAEEFAKVFKGNRGLSAASDVLPPMGSTQGIATSIEGKVHQTIINKLWDTVSAMLPGQGARVKALVNHTARLLDKPLGAKEYQAVASSLPKDKRVEREVLDFTEALNTLRQAAADSKFNPPAAPMSPNTTPTGPKPQGPSGGDLSFVREPVTDTEILPEQKLLGGPSQGK